MTKRPNGEMFLETDTSTTNIASTLSSKAAFADLNSATTAVTVNFDLCR